jgi:diaminopimelate decarboxylase
VTGFSYRNGIFHADDVSLADIAAQVGTPTYVYSASILEKNYRAYSEAFAGQNLGIHFALKANSNLGVVAFLGSLGAGADIVSAGEMQRALAAGIAADRIVFSGVGKTADELTMAVKAGIAQINVESEPELELLAQIAQACGRRQPIALRINPDVDALTHEKISTGKSGDKFGIAYDRALSVYKRAASLPSLDPVGIAVHIGSQLIDFTPYRRAYEKIAYLVRTLRSEGLSVTTLDLGGGIGVTYKDETPQPIGDYAAIVLETVGNLGCALAIEPGRSIVASAGVLLTRAVYRKAGDGNDILIVDAGMNDLIRPSLYDAYHPIWPVIEPATGATVAPVDIVGPICETGDTFARERPLTRIEGGDLLVFGVAGAYGSSMASTYNARPLAAEILVKDGRMNIVRQRQTIEAMFADELVPNWLKAPQT